MGERTGEGGIAVNGTSLSSCSSVSSPEGPPRIKASVDEMETDLEERDPDGSRVPDSDLVTLRLRLRLPDREALDDGSCTVKCAELEAEFGADEDVGSLEPGTCFSNLARSLARLPPFINSLTGSFLRLRRSFDLEFCDFEPSF